MSRNLFWLSDEHGSVLSPICQPMCAARSGPAIAVPSAASFMYSRVAAADCPEAHQANVFVTPFARV